MSARIDRIEARVEPERAERIRTAARLVHASVSSFVVDAAAEKADRILAEQSETIVPASFFDDVLAALDAPPADLPALRRAATRARRTVEHR